MVHSSAIQSQTVDVAVFGTVVLVFLFACSKPGPLCNISALDLLHMVGFACDVWHSFNKNAILILLAIWPPPGRTRRGTVCDAHDCARGFTNLALLLRENKIRTIKPRKR
jgi:hypothetical protein